MKNPIPIIKSKVSKQLEAKRQNTLDSLSMVTNVKEDKDALKRKSREDLLKAFKKK